MGSLKGTIGTPEISPTNSIPAGNCSHKLGQLTFLALEPWVGGLGLLTPEIPLPIFYPPHVDVGPALSASLPLLLVWMNVFSLIS